MTPIYDRPGFPRVVDAVESLCEPGEFVIWRDYEGYSAKAICGETGWELVEDFGHVAIVRRVYR